jgi:amino acid transporter
MFQRILDMLIGKKLPNAELGDQKFNVFWGMPILSSDAICSVVYAMDAIMFILVPVIGAAAFILTPRLAVVIIALLLILTFSYRQTVSAYPNGGGSYIVASENLGRKFGLIAASALCTDYILDVAVSICSAVGAIFSAFPQYPWIYNERVWICLFFIAVMTIGNLRGVKESSRMFSIPTYLFVFAILFMVVSGLLKFYGGHFNPAQVLVAVPANLPHANLTEAAFVYLILKAFASGCAALTGIECVANGVPNFTEPRIKHAQQSYILLGLFTGITFGGVAYMAYLYHGFPSLQTTIVAQMAYDVFGYGVGFWLVQITTMAIMAMAANTAYAGFPMLFSIVANDGYAPRQLANRGHRLFYNNGIMVLAVMASILCIVFTGNTNLLIPLFCVGVFSAFTLSQTGMVIHWAKERSNGWSWKAAVNGIGAVLTAIATVVEAVTKFTSGAWITVILIPLLVCGMLMIHKHYVTVAEDLDVPNDELGKMTIEPCSSAHVIILVDRLNSMVLYALRYARSLGSQVEAFHVETDEGEADKLRRKWAALGTDVPLVIKYSPYRDVVGPLIEHIESAEHASKDGDMITVLLPQFIVAKGWQMLLHNNTSVFIARALLKERSRNIIVSFLPFALRHGHQQHAKIDNTKCS